MHVVIDTGLLPAARLLGNGVLLILTLASAQESKSQGLALFLW